jgi:hypothetical protein
MIKNFKQNITNYIKALRGQKQALTDPQKKGYTVDTHDIYKLSQRGSPMYRLETTTIQTDSVLME